MNILIIGGGSSLGGAFATHMAKLNHNIIVITGKKGKENLAEANIEYIFSPLGNELDVHKIVGNISSKILTIDIIFHNIGGGLGMSDPMITFEDFKKLLWFNFGVIQELNRLLIPKISPKGKIICVGSIATKNIMGSLGYTLAKTSLETYVRFMGQELLKLDISIMAISIGAYWEKGNAMDRLKHNHPEVYQDFLLNRLPRKKMASSEEFLPYLELICLNESSILSGSVIPMYGAESVAL